MGCRTSRLQELQHVGSVVVTHGALEWGFGAVSHKLSCPAHVESNPGPGFELVFPALQDEFLATGL